MDYFSAFSTADGLDFDGEKNLEKGSLQEIETGVVVTVGIFHAEKERIHTPTLRQIQPNQTRIPKDPPLRRTRQRNISSTPRASEK